MAIEDRIRYMLRAAARAEEEGDLRIAEVFRRMAQDALPAGFRIGGPSMVPSGEISRG